MGWIADIGDLIGDWFGNDPKEDEAHRANVEARHSEARDDTAIRRRVNDAQAAGIHPLFALGGSVSGGGSTAMFTGGSGSDRRRDRISSASRVAERFVMGDEDAYRKDLAEAQLRALNADAARNEALAASELARAAQAANVTRPDYSMNLIGSPDFKVTGARTPAQKLQDEYGDVAENIFGTGHLVEDFGRSIAERNADFLDHFIGNVEKGASRVRRFFNPKKSRKDFRGKGASGRY